MFCEHLRSSMLEKRLKKLSHVKIGEENAMTETPSNSQE